MLASAIISIINMDLIDPDLINYYLGLNFDRDEEIVSVAHTTESILIQQVQDLGFETYNAILNLGGLFCFLVLYFI